VCVCFRRKVKDSAGSRCSLCWRRKTCCCLIACHEWENTGSARHTPTLCSLHGTHSHTALQLSFCSFIHTNTPLENQSWYTHLQNSLYTHTHTCKHSQCLHGSADQLGTKNTTAVFLSQLEGNSTKALRLLKACWSCMRRQLLLQGIDLKSKFNWTAAQISLQGW